MCSISGIFLKDSVTVTESELHALAMPLAHRGPDDHGIYRHNNLGLHHHRLSINDLSTLARQPFITASGTVSITNGEIYNAIDIKANQLQHQQFQSKSDCEIIPHLYEKSGIHFLKQLRGMFAGAIYDPQLNQLHLYRDCFGMKQLYYIETAAGVYFASEIRALTKHLNISQPNLAVVLATAELHFSLDERTAISGIKRVLPGELITITDGQITHKVRSQSTRPRQRIQAKQALTEFDAIFEETVARHLQSNVPIGLFLSGGIDSTSLLTMCHRLRTPLHTYTIKFLDSESNDESALARHMSQKTSAHHHEVNFSEEDFWDYLPSAILATDDPTADPAIVPTFKLASAAKGITPVILSGEGGDEMFAGYGRYRKFISPFSRYQLYANTSLINFNLIKVQTDWQDTLQQLKTHYKNKHTSRLNYALDFDRNTWLPNDLLIKLDRTLMWHSLEGRTPFLDNAILAFADRCAPELLVRGRKGKWILRSWLESQLSDYDAFAKKKGFTVPLRPWLNRRRGWVLDRILDSALIQTIFDTHEIKKILASPLGKSEVMVVWSLLYFALWDAIHLNNHDITHVSAHHTQPALIGD